MSDGWARHTWRNEWQPVRTIKPEVGRLVEVWAFTDTLLAVYGADGQFRTRDGRCIENITHWRDARSSGDNRELSD